MIQLENLRNTVRISKERRFFTGYLDRNQIKEKEDYLDSNQSQQNVSDILFTASRFLQDFYSISYKVVSSPYLILSLRKK